MDIKIALLTIGTEITSGLEADTNSYYLSRELFNHGFVVDKHVSVSDSIKNVVEAFRALIGYQVIITTGGIGPTDDDLTRESIAQALNLPLEINQPMFEKIKQRGTKEKYAQKVSSFPKGARIIEAANQFSLGGFFLEYSNALIITLPGVPVEIEAIFHKNVLPVIDARFKPKIAFRRRLFKIANLKEVQVEEKLQEIKANFSYGLLPKPGEVHLYVTTKAEHSKIAQEQLEKIDRQLSKILSHNLFGRGDETLEQVVVGQLIANKLTLAAAESSTGGLVSQRVCSIAGASETFIGSFVTYSNSLKEELGVPSDVLRAHGAVSEQVAELMASSARQRARSDIAVSVTGIAGPGGATKSKPLGLHYLALSSKTKEIVKKFIFKGTREQIRRQASQQALFMVREALNGH